MILEHWGATGDEISGVMPGDELVPDATLVATRSITLDAPPSEVFPWLRQMGFGRAGWYSHDLLDNLGRRSATRIHPEWQEVHAGDAIPGGPADFRAAIVEPPTAFVLALINRRIGFTLAYRLEPDRRGTRLVTRVRAHVRVPGGRLIERTFLGPGDGIMLRKQLTTLAERVATAQAGPSSIDR
jgi:hypothetical protein